MNTQEVFFYTTERIPVTTYAPDRFSLRKDRGWIPVQRLAFWVLSKIGCFAPITIDTVKRHVIKTDSLIEMLYRERNELLQSYNENCERLLMGPEEYRQLTNEDIYGRVSFSAPYTRMTGKPMICDMEVTVIPWMKGMLVVPKEDRL